MPLVNLNLNYTVISVHFVVHICIIGFKFCKSDFPFIQKGKCARLPKTSFQNLKK